ncbi:p26 protein [Fig virus B]|uniref:p26 n=1 Tax=Fig closterovirus 1 TaxID=2809010 RepID=A0A8A0XWC0_9CLOS|nr:p26 protein [Fig virus B]QSQ86315.1 p26 [Fig closterovirus 1]
MLLRMVMLLIILVYVTPVKTGECPYEVSFLNGTKLSYVVGSTQFKCSELETIEIKNLQHEACRVSLVNIISSMNEGFSTLIESTAQSGTLYYDISLVDGLTCLPDGLVEKSRYIEKFPECNSYILCGESLCKSQCSMTRDVHECELEKPYTVRWEEKLRSSCINENSRIYTSAYDDYRGLRISNSTSIFYTFRKRGTDRDLPTNHASHVWQRTILRIIINLIIYIYLDIS